MRNVIARPAKLPRRALAFHRVWWWDSSKDSK
jgi:hypothetical protein